MTTPPTTTLPLARTPRTILCLGDSITGWSDLSRWLKWSHILEAMLEARCGAGAYRVLNHGIGGNTTADLLGRLQEDALAVRPDIVTLLISGNDAYRSFPPWAGTHGYRAKDLVGEDSVHTNNGGELVYGRAVFYKLVELGWVNTHPRLSLFAQRNHKCLHREDENSRNGRSTL